MPTETELAQLAKDFLKLLEQRDKHYENDDHDSAFETELDIYDVGGAMAYQILHQSGE